jgi:cytochrome c biogenesis protein CcmG/thiol:disulfide interchange protein DsbE
MARLRYLVPLGVFVAIGLLLGVGLTLDSEEVPSPLIGKPVPSFELPALANADRSVQPADLEGRVWLLNVWASWCAPCLDEHPLLMRAAGRDGLTVVGLNYKDERQAALQWLERHGDPYALAAYDPKGRAGLDLGVYGVPETYVIDRSGVIRYKHVGPLSEQELEDEILPLVRDLGETS